MTLDLTKQKFNHLSPQSPTTKRSGGSIVWKCLCDCGDTVEVAARDLLHGKQQSHPRCTYTKTLPHPLYSTWAGIKSRCYNKTSPNYKNYGARGVQMSDSWRQSFTQFLADMGEKPSHAHTIERINNDGNYCKENCKWALPSEQIHNRRDLKLSSIQIIHIYNSRNTIPAKLLADQLKVAPKTIYNIRSKTYSKAVTELCNRLGV